MNSVTIENFSSLLEEVFLIFFNKIFHPSVRKQEKIPRKIYSIDTGICNAVGFRMDENIGNLMENLVAIEMKRKNFEVYYWKEYGKAEGREVDFVIRENSKIKQLIQVTYASSKDEIEKREIKALVKASEELKCKDLLIITWDLEDESEVKRKKLSFCLYGNGCWAIKFSRT